ncbi:GrpB family protein [Roseomonas elaeocarpi]|uniref:GrpB family protein n=1 Tax=Roseomonas elaeocarpi TaxID=907779 RepID=A0ABV6JM41_9PROT
MVEAGRGTVGAGAAKTKIYGHARCGILAFMLGLKHNINCLVDYDPAWPTEFARERKRIADALGGLAKGIEHYGSTSVAGMRAKPIIDILIGVAPFEDWEKCKAPLEKLGYDYAAHAGVPGHHIFGRGRDATERTHLAHVVEFSGEEWRSNLALRNALRIDERLRAAYVAEKERAAVAAPEGRARYNALKHDFLVKVKASLL